MTELVEIMIILNSFFDGNFKQEIKDRTTLLGQSRPMVSVYVNCYNHESYLRQALDSIISQRIDFKMEVLVRDDCSTDNTRAIILEYEKKYPEIIIAFLENENLFSKKISDFASDILPLCRGRYLAVCEGDDYWLDNNKLTKQVRYLESNPDCILLYNNSVFVDQNNHKTQDIYGIYSPKSEQDYTLDMFSLGYEFPGQTASSIIRKSFYDDMSESMKKEYFQLRGNGDTKKIFGALLVGRVHIQSDFMSAYRIVTQDSDSWSARNFGRNGSADRLAMELDYKRYAKRFYSISYKNNWKIFVSGMGCLVKAIYNPSAENREVLKKGISEFTSIPHFLIMMFWFGLTGLFQKIAKPTVRLIDMQSEDGC